MTSFFLFLYQLGLLPFGLAYLLLRLLRGRGVPGWRQRLGIYSPEVKKALVALDGPVWIHMVSVGEVLGGERLIQELRALKPEMPWVITTTTSTGRSVAEKLVRGNHDQLIYLPWDLGFAVRRAVEAVRPSLFICFETELWPVLFHRLAASGVPIAVVNGRISPNAYKKYLWVRPFMEIFLKPVRLFLVQSPQDARRYAGVGASKDRVVVTGNIKWDLNPEEASGANGQPDLRVLLGLAPRDLLWTAGSTHSGEEEILFKTYQRLKPVHPGLRLLIAPRHPERVAEVERMAAVLGITTVRKSGLGSEGQETGGREQGAGGEVILLDTLGELKSFYQVSDLVFVGGSLVPRGGHNLVEPAAFRRPILTGPHLHNFANMAELLAQAGGIAVVKSPEELERQVKNLVENPRRRQELGDRAFTVIAQNKGATAKTAQLLLRLRSGQVSKSRGGDSPMITGLLSAGESVYRTGLKVVNKAYKSHWLKTHTLPAQLVSVGNLTWGGTGKTPMVLHLAKVFSGMGRRVAVLTRGYGGDEEKLLSGRLAPIPVLVNPDRIASGQKAVREFGADLVLLDDGYQQWRLKKDVEILMVNAEAPFGNGHLIPRGTLREPSAAAGRADIIVIKAETGSLDLARQAEEQIRLHNKTAPVFVAVYKPVSLSAWPLGEKVPLKVIKKSTICSLAGIAKPEQFETELKRLGAEIALRCRVGDHHPYSAGELIRIFSRCRRHGINRLVTTAKDAVRFPALLTKTLGADLKGMEILVLEVDLEFEPDESQLLHRINSLLVR